MKDETREAPADQSGSVPIMGTISRDTLKEQIAQEVENTQKAQDVIYINTDVDPELNPADPRFNLQKYREYLTGLDLSEIEARLTKAITRAKDAAAAVNAEITQSGIIPAVLQDTLISSLRDIMEIGNFANAGAQQMLLPELKKLFSAGSFLDQINWDGFTEGLRDAQKRIDALKPFLQAELPAINQTPGYEDITIADLEGCITLTGDGIAETFNGAPIPETIKAAITRALEAAARAALPKAAAKKTDIIEYPVDKVNSAIWNILQETTGKQTKLPLKAEKDGDAKPLNIYYSIDFDELESTGIRITKRLLPFDKRVYIAVSALYNAGNSIISLTQIYYAMGNTGKPAKYQLEKINESVTKMRKASVFIDTLEESQKYNYPRFKYENYLLPVARIEALVNGKLSEAAIKLNGEPPLITFAKQRKQITTITVKLLQSPLSKTDANLLIDDYLIERIARAKVGKQPAKILYDTLFEKAEIKTAKQKQRAPEKIKIYLEHYKACGLITGYQMLKDGIQLDF